MKRSQFDDIASLYTEKVWKEAPLLNEMVPPFEVGSTPNAPIKVTDRKNEYKAFNPAIYKSKDARGGISTDDEHFDSVAIAIVGAMGKKLLKIIQDSGGRIEDSTPELHQRMAQLMMDHVKIGEKKIFTSISHAQHLARNVIDALKRANKIKEVDSSRGKHKTSRSSSTPAPAANSFNFGDEDLDAPV